MHTYLESIIQATPFEVDQQTGILSLLKQAFRKGMDHASRNS
ncbi:hypothetical protein [Cytobacillus kochii]|nr:hypothetical protein [Cytobacillus kochii]